MCPTVSPFLSAKVRTGIIVRKLGTECVVLSPCRGLRPYGLKSRSMVEALTRIS